MDPTTSTSLFSIRQWHYLALAVLCFTVFSNTLNHEFHLDDSYGIMGNPAIRSLKNIPSFFVDPSTICVFPPNVDYRPLIAVTYALNYAISGLNMWSWHITHILLHLLCAIMLYHFIEQICSLVNRSEKKFSAPAFITALFFAIHPYVSGVVNYQWARSSLQAAAFLLISLFFYVVYRKHPKKSTYCISLLCFLLALLSKVEAIAGLAVFWLIEALAYSSTNPKKNFFVDFYKANLLHWKTWSTFVGIAVIYLTVRYEVMPPDALQGLRRSPIHPYHYLLTQFTTWWHYVHRWFVPISLIADDTAYPVYTDIFQKAVLLSVAGWAVVLTFLVSLWKQRPEIVFFAFSGLVLISPTSSFMPLAEMVNEHRPYLPLAVASAAWVIPFIEKIESMGRSKNLARLLPIIFLIMVLSLITWRRNEAFINDASYWGDVLAKSPSARSHNNFGLASMRRGDYDTAMKHFRKSEDFAPDWFINQINIGLIFKQRGELKKAEHYFNRAVDLEKGSYIALGWRKQFYKETGRPEKAAQDSLRLSTARP